ncbi:TetR/AcrR family transcriptional regulator [Bacillus sp. CGMCC 1.16607]|uniref:TetR/AcrR family transcriptional regulator n=1 Tax=Bacillus sp. CGMCC 1.16607 TaxID=3351842 RepID=UPI00362C3574
MENINEQPVLLDKNLQPIINNTKNLILHTAIDLFSQRGYRGVSIRQITGQVGIKESSLYKHFKNKEDILDIIFANFEVEVVKILPPEEEIEMIAKMMSPKEFLERGLQNFMDHIGNLTMRKIWRIIYNEMFSDARAREIYFETIQKKTFDRVELIFAHMIALGKIPPHDPRILSMEYHYPLYAMVMEYNALKFEVKSTVEIEHSFHRHIDFFVKSITT